MCHGLCVVDSDDNAKIVDCIIQHVNCYFIMVLWNRADHYIFILSFVLFSFPRLISAAADWMSAILPHMV